MVELSQRARSNGHHQTWPSTSGMPLGVGNRLRARSELTSVHSTQQNKLLINNEWRPAASGKTMDVVNPATEEVIASVPAAEAADLDAAVAAARAALDGPWGTMSARERGRLVRKLGDRLMERADEVARLETLHNGKPISESRHIEIPAAAECFEYYAGWSDKVMGETIPVKGNYLTYTLREPIGVVAAIVPWNFPLLLAVVEGGAGAGVRQHRHPEAGEPDAADRAGARRDRGRGRAAARRAQRHYRRRLEGRSGARRASRHRQDRVHRRHQHRQGRSCASAADTLKKITLELGGKSPNIVLADADIEAAIRGATIGIFYGKGEVCAAGSRLLVDRSIKDEFIDKLSARAKKMVPGDPMDPKTRFGAISSKKQLETVLRYVETGKKRRRDARRRRAAGGHRHRQGLLRPADGVRRRQAGDDDLARGDLRPGARRDRVRRSRRGDRDRERHARTALAAGVWTRDIKKAHYVARKLQAGTVWINTYNVYDTAAPFGGYKQSGFGREMSAHALEHYTQVKSVWVDLNL